VIATWEVRPKPDGDLDEVLAAYARRIVLRPGPPGRWDLTIDLAEGGRLAVVFRSAHGIRGAWHVDQISPRCPWLGPLSPPLTPSMTARYLVDEGRGGRLLGLELDRPNFLHMERMDVDAYWMSMSMPDGDLLVTWLTSAARIVGDLRHEVEPDLSSHPPARHHGVRRAASGRRRRTEILR